MEKIMNFMQNSFAPKVNKITKNVWVSSIQDAVMAVLPFILVGSLITLVSLINEIKPILPDLTLVNSFSFGMIGLFVAFLIPYFVMDKKKYTDKKLIAGLASVSLYLMLIVPSFNGETGEITFTFERFGATGMFVAIIVGLIVALVMSLFSRWSLFGEESSLPDFIIVWFDTLIPVTLLFIGGWLCISTFEIDFFEIIVKLMSPLMSIGQSFWGFVLIAFLMTFLYSFGIST